MERDATRLRRLLLDSGLSRSAVDAAWPSWWAQEADGSPSARAELRFALARRLGLSPKGLTGDRVEFVWRDEARFKHLTSETAEEQAALTSFGISVGQLLLRATPATGSLPDLSADKVRAALLGAAPWVDLSGLLAVAWGLGIPVIHLRVFPLSSKSMNAMVVTAGGRPAILLGRDAQYPAPVAFTLAHEIGHIALGHLGEASALVDLDDSGSPLGDDQENEADRYALEVLTGTPEPRVVTNIDNFTAISLAGAAMQSGQAHGIEPGTLALVLGFQSGRWPIANKALEKIYDAPRSVWHSVNAFAANQLDMAALGEDGAEFLTRVMALNSV